MGTHAGRLGHALGRRFQSVSAGLNGAGQAVVYGVLTDDSLWEYNPAFAGDHWQNLSPAGTILRRRAGGVGPGVRDHGGPSPVAALAASGWSLTSAGSFASISGEDNGGAGEVFGVLADASLWEYSAGWAELDAGVLAALRRPARLSRRTEPPASASGGRTCRARNEWRS